MVYGCKAPETCWLSSSRKWWPSVTICPTGIILRKVFLCLSTPSQFGWVESWSVCFVFPGKKFCSCKYLVTGRYSSIDICFTIHLDFLVEMGDVHEC